MEKNVYQEMEAGIISGLLCTRIEGFGSFGVLRFGVFYFHLLVGF